MTPALFEMAVSGNADGIYSVLEDGDFVNPQVNLFSVCIYSRVLCVFPL